MARPAKPSPPGTEVGWPEALCSQNSTMAAICNRPDEFDFDGDGSVGAEEATVAFFGVNAWCQREGAAPESSTPSQMAIEAFGEATIWDPELMQLMFRYWAMFLVRNSTVASRASMLVTASEAVAIVNSQMMQTDGEEPLTITSTLQRETTTVTPTTQSMSLPPSVFLTFDEWMAMLRRPPVPTSAEASPCSEGLWMNATFLDTTLLSSLQFPWSATVTDSSTTSTARCLGLDGGGEFISFPPLKGAAITTTSIVTQWAKAFRHGEECPVPASVIDKTARAIRERDRVSAVHYCACNLHVVAAVSNFCALNAQRSEDRQSPAVGVLPPLGIFPERLASSGRVHVPFLNDAAGLSRCLKDGRVGQRDFVEWYVTQRKNRVARGQIVDRWQQIARDVQRGTASAEQRALVGRAVTHPAWIYLLASDVSAVNRSEVIAAQAAKLFESMQPQRNSSAPVESMGAIGLVTRVRCLILPGWVDQCSVYMHRRSNDLSSCCVFFVRPLAKRNFSSHLVYDPVLDINGDGTLTDEELLGLFDAMDRDEDGHISAADFASVYADLAASPIADGGSVDSAVRRRIASKVFASVNTMSPRRRVSLLLRRQASTAHTSVTCSQGRVTRAELRRVWQEPVLDLDSSGLVDSKEISVLWRALLRDHHALNLPNITNGPLSVFLDRVVALYQLLQLNPVLKATFLKGNHTGLPSSRGKRKEDVEQHSLEISSDDGATQSNGTTSARSGEIVDSFFYTGTSESKPLSVRSRPQNRAWDFVETCLFILVPIFSW